MTENNNVKKRFICWEKYHALVLDLAKKIDTRPELIVSIGKGGSIPGVILAEHFKVLNLNMGLSSYNGSNKGELFEYQCIGDSFERIRNKNILIVDDLSDYGDTLDFAVNKFKSQGLEKIKTSTIFIKPRTKHMPNYYVEQVPNSTWIVHPWEFS
jgi:hypoxanthine phosphoribosyltransferase